MTGDYDKCIPEWEVLSDEAKDLITMLLKVKPSERITGEQILKHPWFCSFEDDRSSCADSTY